MFGDLGCQLRQRCAVDADGPACFRAWGCSARRPLACQIGRLLEEAIDQWLLHEHLAGAPDVGGRGEGGRQPEWHENDTTCTSTIRENNEWRREAREDQVAGYQDTRQAPHGPVWVESPSYQNSYTCRMPTNNILVRFCVIQSFVTSITTPTFCSWNLESGRISCTMIPNRETPKMSHARSRAVRSLTKAGCHHAPAHPR